MSAATPGVGKGSRSRTIESFAALIERRWLIAYFVQRELSKNYRTSFLGIIWILLGPIIMVALYTLIFSEIIGLRFRETPGVVNFGLYLYCGLIPFLAYSETANKAVGSIRINASLVQKVVFPLQVLPFSTAVAAVVSQVFGLVALAIVSAVLGQVLHLTALLIPLLMILQLLFMLGLGYILSVVGTYLPDTQETLRAFVRASFFMTPIIWPIERVADKPYLSLVVDLNPLAYLVGAYRALLLDGELPGMTATLYFTLFAVGLCILGFVWFNRVKQRFADLI